MKNLEIAVFLNLTLNFVKDDLIIVSSLEKEVDKLPVISNGNIKFLIDWGGWQEF